MKRLLENSKGIRGQQVVGRPHIDVAASKWTSKNDSQAKVRRSLRQDPTYHSFLRRVKGLLNYGFWRRTEVENLRTLEAVHERVQKDLQELPQAQRSFLHQLVDDWRRWNNEGLFTMRDLMLMELGKKVNAVRSFHEYATSHIEREMRRASKDLEETTHIRSNLTLFLFPDIFQTMLTMEMDYMVQVRLSEVQRATDRELMLDMCDYPFIKTYEDRIGTLRGGYGPPHMNNFGSPGSMWEDRLYGRSHYYEDPAYYEEGNGHTDSLYHDRITGEGSYEAKASYRFTTDGMVNVDNDLLYRGQARESVDPTDAVRHYIWSIVTTTTRAAQTHSKRRPLSELPAILGDDRYYLATTRSFPRLLLPEGLHDITRIPSEGKACIFAFADDVKVLLNLDAGDPLVTEHNTHFMTVPTYIDVEVTLPSVIYRFEPEPDA